MRTPSIALPSAAPLPGCGPLLEVRGLGKSFPGVRALDDVSLTLRSGEILALLGENGAGKSTLIKMLAGVFAADDGEILIDGREVDIHSPKVSQRLGIGVIHQEFNLIPTLTVTENLFLGRERGWLSPVPARRERAQAQALFDRLGIHLPPHARVRDLSVAEQQLVEIAKALLSDSRILVMDEPTAALSPREVEALFRIMRDLTLQGLGIIYISHRLDEIYELSQRATVLRDGRHVGTCELRSTPREKLIEMMVGRTLAQEFPVCTRPLGPVRLRVQGLTREPVVKNVSLEVRAGEILGLTGLVGAGRTEAARLIFGADTPDSGTISLDGHSLKINSPRSAIRAGICLLTEDRKQQGLILRHPLIENFGLPNLNRFSRYGCLSVRQEWEAFAQHSTNLRLKAHSPRQPAGTLSGGNQQKVVLAKWLERQAEVIIFDEPTRGIDVGARLEIYELMNDLCRQGKAILMITSEFPEALGMSDRILVMHEGRITGEITNVRSATQEQLLQLAIA